MHTVNPIQGIKAYLDKNTNALRRGILNFGTINLKIIWSVNKTAKKVPKNALASLLAQCNVIIWANYSSYFEINLKISLLCKK